MHESLESSETLAREHHHLRRISNDMAVPSCPENCQFLSILSWKEVSCRVLRSMLVSCMSSCYDGDPINVNIYVI